MRTSLTSPESCKPDIFWSLRRSYVAESVGRCGPSGKSWIATHIHRSEQCQPWSALRRGLKNA
eukprot:6206747-Pleurochrysis_carterae.AAC.9